MALSKSEKQNAAISSEDGMKLIQEYKRGI